jgi:hypothetical protein
MKRITNVNGIAVVTEGSGFWCAYPAAFPDRISIGGTESLAILAVARADDLLRKVQKGGTVPALL